MATVRDISACLDRLAPRDAAYSWDNNGLLLGWQDREVSKILVALDPFEGAAREAAEFGAQVLITHHPLIFQPAKAITDGSSVGKTALFLLEHGISAINAHTCLDVAQGGVNDVLARTIGLQEVEILGEEHLLRQGIVESQPLEAFLDRVKTALGTPVLRYADGGRPCHKIAVGGGACASELGEVIAAGCDTFVTSDVKYNQFWDAADAGVSIIDAGHFYTENPVCAVLARELSRAFPEITVKISENHRDCMKFF